MTPRSRTGENDIVPSAGPTRPPRRGRSLSKPHAALLLVFFALRALATAREPAALAPGIYAEIVTPRGTLWAELYFERAPLTVANFVGLAEGKLGPRPGVPFYNGLSFHRVVPGFVVQGGDPAGTGEGGPGYVLPDEFDPLLSHDAAGILSMANEGPDTNGSQFFITLAPVRRLDFLHSVFGKLIRGFDVVSRIQQEDRMSIVLHRRGDKAKAFAADQDAVDRLAATKAKYRDTASSPFFTDLENLLPTDPPRAKTFQHKLANVARATGQRIFARLESGDGLSAEDRYKRVCEIAAALGLEQKGVLAVHFSVSDLWIIHVGTADAERLAREPQAGALEDQKRQWLGRAEANAAQWVKEAENSGHAPDIKQRIKLKVDGVLNQLIEVFVVPPKI